MKNLNLTKAIATLLIVFAMACAAMAQDAPPPFTQRAIISAIKSGKFEDDAIVKAVGIRGVTFEVTSDVEQNLREAGALSDVIAATRSNYRSSSSQTSSQSNQSAANSSGNGKIFAAVSDSLPVGKYICNQLFSTGNAVAGNLYIVNGSKYKFGGGEGIYSFNAKTRVVQWTSGPMRQPSENWVGIFTAEGQATGYDSVEEAGQHLIDIRRQADVDEGADNARVVYRCQFVKQ